MQCQGPLTKWGGYNSKWPAGGYTTQLDIYLDAAYATANADTYGGNMACLLPPGDATEPACKGTRFDYSSAINNTSGTHLRDFGFNVSTGLAGDTCSGFIVIGTTNVDRIGANPNGPGGLVHSHFRLVHVQAHVLRGRWLPQGADGDHSGQRRSRDGELDHLGDGCHRDRGLQPVRLVHEPGDLGLADRQRLDDGMRHASPGRRGAPARGRAAPGRRDPSRLFPPSSLFPPCRLFPRLLPPSRDQEVGNEIINRNVRACIIEVRALGPSQVLSRAVPRGAGGGHGPPDRAGQRQDPGARSCSRRTSAA